jgi:hypothetical protein
MNPENQCLAKGSVLNSIDHTGQLRYSTLLIIFEKPRSSHPITLQHGTCGFVNLQGGFITLWMTNRIIGSPHSVVPLVPHNRLLTASQRFALAEMNGSWVDNADGLSRSLALGRRVLV